MKRDSNEYTYSHPIEDERGNKECEYYSQRYTCCNGHVAYTWHVNNDPYSEDFYPEFDGQIDYIDAEGEVLFSENVFNDH